MAHTCTNLVYHIVFSTKDRLPSIVPDIRDRLHAYLGGIVRELGGEPLIIGGTADHVHTLVRVPPKLALSDVVRITKANSSRWVHETWPQRRIFAWQSAYAAFSVSQSSVARVVQYVSNQQKHHATRDFKAELMDFLRANDINVDERYLWT